MIAAWLLAAEIDLPRLLSVERSSGGQGHTLVLSFSGAVAAPRVSRDGAVLRISTAARAESLSLPDPEPPIAGIELRRLDDRLEVVVEVPLDARHRVSAAESRIVLTIEPREAVADVERPSVAELFPRLFARSEELAPPAPGGEADAAEPEGVLLGPFRVHPSVTVNVVDVTIEPHEGPPSQERYFEVQPMVSANLSLLDGRVRLAYVPSLRRFSSEAAGAPTSHRVSASAELAFGPGMLNAGHEFTRGLLEVREVDPGREYPAGGVDRSATFRLGRFTRNATAFGYTTETGGGTKLSVGGTLERLDIAEGSAFFDHSRRTGTVKLLREVRPSLNAGVAYDIEVVPPPSSRPEAESRSHGIGLTLQGELAPLLDARLAASYRRLDAPHAPDGGRAFAGLTFSGILTREVGLHHRVSIGGSRSTHTSAFERNAFFVATGVQAEVDTHVPFEIALRGTVGHQWNEYRLPSRETGLPREDRILGWSVGAGRALTRWLQVRVDRAVERRRSNVPSLNLDATGWTVQATLGLPERRR